MSLPVVSADERSGGGALTLYGLIGHSGTCDNYGYCPTEPNVPEVVIGSALFAGGLIGGLVLWSRSDVVTFTVSPGAGAPPSAARGSAPTDRKAATPIGSGLTGAHVTLAF